MDNWKQFQKNNLEPEETFGSRLLTALGYVAIVLAAYPLMIIFLSL